MKLFSFSRFSTSHVPRPAFLITISLLMIVMLSACGKKGPVRPKVAMQITAPTEVTLQQQGISSYSAGQFLTTTIMVV